MSMFCIHTVRLQLSERTNEFLAGLKSNSGLWIVDVHLSVHPSVCLWTFWLTFVFKFWNLLCNSAISSSALSCCYTDSCMNNYVHTDMILLNVIIYDLQYSWLMNLLYKWAMCIYILYFKSEWGYKNSYERTCGIKCNSTRYITFNLFVTNGHTGCRAWSWVWDQVSCLNLLDCSMISAKIMVNHGPILQGFLHFVN